MCPHPGNPDPEAPLQEMHQWLPPILTACARSPWFTWKKPAIPCAGIIEHLEPDVHRLVARALHALERSAVYRAATLVSPAAVRAHLQLRLASLDHEQFVALWLDAQNRLIATNTLLTWEP